MTGIELPPPDWVAMWTGVVALAMALIVAGTVLVVWASGTRTENRRKVRDLTDAVKAEIAALDSHEYVSKHSSYVISSAWEHQGRHFRLDLYEEGCDT